MNQDEEISLLQAELAALRKELGTQHQRLQALQQRIARLQAPHAEKPLLPQFRQWTLENFIGLRLIHLIGIVVLVIGLSLGVKYAIDRELISAGARILLAYMAGVALYILSIRLRRKYEAFSAILFSGSMASLYFTTYAAHVYYAMIPFMGAFIIMVVLTIYTSYEALRYNRQEIGLLGLVGAYAIPFLISKNADQAFLFFVYIMVINIGVVFLVIRKQWKRVGITAQAVTWILYLAWASTKDTRDQLTTGVFFLITFFLIFTLMVASFKRRQARFTEHDTYQLVLNNLALYLGALFMSGVETFSGLTLAMITLGTSLLVALQAFVTYYYWKDEGWLARVLATLSLMLFVLFIAFQWEGITVTLLWLLTAVVIFLWGFYKASVSGRLAGVLLMGATLAKLVMMDSQVFSTLQKVIAYLILGVLLLAVSFFYQKYRKEIFGKEKERGDDR